MEGNLGINSPHTTFPNFPKLTCKFMILGNYVHYSKEPTWKMKLNSDSACSLRL